MDVLSGPRLTYCGNVHAAETLDEWIEGVERFAVPIAAGAPRPFALGVWWNAAIAGALAHEGPARARVRELLLRHELEVATCNAFPYGGFHDPVVKQAVYRPDWSDEQRLAYTRDVAHAAASFARAGETIPVSTLPLGFGLADLRVMARNLVRAASMLADLEAKTGVRVLLALEPEPFCLLETVADTVRFLEEWVLREGAWRTVDERVLRRHLGVCVDLCHLAVVGEDPLVAAALLRARGIEVGKIQISSCLELREPARALPRLLAFDEPRWLHQTVADDGTRALDLGEVRARSGEFARARRVRTHFHVPVNWLGDHELGSTSNDVARALGSWPLPLPLCEVETYTWSVLAGHEPGRKDLVTGIREELEFARLLISR